MPRQWSIGICTGASPVGLMGPPSTSPVLTANDVTDANALFVADPFMIRRGDTWYMFFEIMDADTRRGVIGLATSQNLQQWEYKSVVLKEAFHLSYPHVFQADGQYYMVLETLDAGYVSLYIAESFPDRWRFFAALTPGQHADPTIIHHDQKWWMFTCSSPQTHDTLNLFFADELTGPWREHPGSPLISQNPRDARPGGRIIHVDGKLIRFAQDCTPQYGTRVRAFSIDELSIGQYSEHELIESPIFGPGLSDWNQGGMHHIDAHCLPDASWVACVDGWVL